MGLQGSQVGTGMLFSHSICNMEDSVDDLVYLTGFLYSFYLKNMKKLMLCNQVNISL